MRYKKGNVDGKLMLSSFLRGSGGNQSVKGRKASLCREAKAAAGDDDKEDDDDDEEDDDDDGDDDDDEEGDDDDGDDDDEEEDVDEGETHEWR